MNSEHSLIDELIRRNDELRAARIVGCSQLAGDMSSRRFFRVTLEQAPVPSVLLVVLAGALGPVGGGPRGLTQDDTYVEVNRFLSEAGIRVPRLFVDGRDRGALIVEDVGNVSLLAAARHFQQGDASVEPLPPTVHLGADPLYELFAKALELQRSFMQLRRDDSVVVYQRSVTAEQRRTQIREFIVHYAQPRGLSEQAVALVEPFLDSVCDCVASHPLQVVHFDFMASNIHVLPDGELCVIDFQDMCLDSPARDVVSLLNDRGLDEALGRERQQRLLAFYTDQINRTARFSDLYDEYLLLWDFRVAGRFALLAHKRGVGHYAEWIPGTLRRLGRTLARVQGRIAGAHEALRVLTAFSPEIAEGARDPWGAVPC
jgi:aminoglycoside/choline kinase family phosphotransferase